MKLVKSLLVTLALVAAAFGQQSLNNASSYGQGEFYAPAYNYSTFVFSGSVTAGNSGTLTVFKPYVTLQDKRVVNVFATTASILIGQGANQETVTPSSVSSGCSLINVGAGNGGGTNNQCTITATFTYAHGQGDQISSGTYGLQEALNDAKTQGGGLVVVDARWTTLGGTNAMYNAATTSAGVGLDDFRSGTNNVGSQMVYGACTGVATSSVTIGLYGAAENTVTTCTSTTTNLGQIMNHAGTLRTLTGSATAGGFNGSSGVMTVLKNNSATAVTCTFGTGTTCTDTTHTAAYVAGDIISIQFTTQGTETLAGVKASVIAQ